MEITSIEANKKNKGKLSVYIDNKYSFSVSEEDYLSVNLYEKKQITEQELDYIKNNILFRAAKSAAIRYLTFKLRSEKEVHFRLSSDGYGDDITEKVVEELKALGYINDKLYAQKFIYDRSRLKPKSKKMLRMELKNKGVADEITEEVLDEWNVDDTTVAEGLVKKKFGKYDIRDEKIIKRIYSFLQHRGFNFETVSNIISKINNGQV